MPLFIGLDPHLTLFAVVEEVADQIRLGVGVEHTTAGGPPQVSTRVHVPVFQVARRESPALIGSGGLPPWLLLGTTGARVEIGVDATFTEAAPTPGESALAGVTISLGVPTAPGDQLAVAFELLGLQLPGAAQPRTVSIDATTLDELGADVLDLLLGLTRAQADALSDTDPSIAPFRAVAGILGLRDVAGLPPLPLAELPTNGLAAVVAWVEEVLADNTARDAWLGELASLVGGTVVAESDAVLVSAGQLTVLAGIRVEPGASGCSVLVPWVELSLNTRSGARARLAADLLRADTGAGVCTALPDLRAEAVFGADAGGSALLPGAAPHMGSLHTGFALDSTGRPAFILTVHDVVATAGGPHHDVVDLSSPSAALDAAQSVIEAALADAIDGLGPAGALVNGLLGLDPPSGIDPIDVLALFSHPVAVIRTYWRDLTGSPAAAADVLGRLRALITDAPTAPVPGAGTAADPWRVELFDGVELDVWRDADQMLADLVCAVTTPVLGEYGVTASFGVTLLRADLSAGSAAFAAEAHGSLAFRRRDDELARLPIGAVALEAADFVARANWVAARGLRVSFTADRLAVRVGDTSLPIDLRTLNANGTLVSSAPDWDTIQDAAAALLAELRVPVIDALVGLVGWSGSGPQLSLAGLFGADPGAAVRDWLADLVLDRQRVRLALGSVAALLSGFGRGAPVGSGSARDPLRCPVSGDRRAPGLAVWTDPTCAARYEELIERVGAVTSGELPDPDAIVGLLRGSSVALPDLADLLVGRDSLGEGLALLITRWTGTDGLTGRPASLPDDVTAVELAGLSYDELVALGSVGLLIGELFDPIPAAVVHVCCEPTWLFDRPAGTAFDRSGTETTGSVPASGPGIWFVRLPTPAAAAAARPDRGGVGEQAARLAAVLGARSDPVVLMGYGECGAAVLRAANALGSVSDAVTIGTPWAGLAVDSLRSGLGGDALRMLGRLGLRDEEPWPDQLLAQQATPREQANRIIRRSLGVLAPGTDLPSAGAEVRRSGLAVHAVFGSLGEDTVSGALAAFVTDGVQARVVAAPTPHASGDMALTALHAGVHIPVIDLNLAGLLVGVGATVELCHVIRATSGLGLDVSLVRGVVVDLHLGVHDGWLVGGPGSGNTVGDLRWMSARIDVPLDGRPGDAELVLHEASGFGVRSRTVGGAGGPVRCRARHSGRRHHRRGARGPGAARRRDRPVADSITGPGRSVGGARAGPGRWNGPRRPGPVAARHCRHDARPGRRRRRLRSPPRCERWSPPQPAPARSCAGP